MRRGSIVIVDLAGDYGKPRPAVVIQSRDYLELLSVVVCPLTSDLEKSVVDLRIPVAPSQRNGLRETSIIMIDKVSAVPRSRIRTVIGHLETATMMDIDIALARFLGLA